MKLAPILILCLAIGIRQTRSEPIILELIGSGIGTASSLAQGGIGTASGIAQGAIGAASGLAQGGIGTASGLAQGALGTASGIVQGAVGAASGIARGAIGTATSIGNGVAGIGTEILSNIANTASSVTKDIGAKINDVQSKVLKRALTQVEDKLQSVQDAARGALQATEIASKQVASGIVELENRQAESIQEWSDHAKNKLANSSEEVQLQGQDLIEGFADKRTEDLKKCSDKIYSQLENLQEKANATAERYHQPMNDLISEIGKGSNLKANDFRGQASFAADIRKRLAPLSSLPEKVLDLKSQIVKAGFQNLQKKACVTSTLSKFRKEACRVDKEIDKLVEEDKKNQKNAEEEPEPEEGPVEEPAADEPAANEPAADEPAADEPAADEPAADEPAADEPAADEPAADEPAADEPAADEPADEE